MRDLLQPKLPKSVGLEVIIPVEKFPEIKYVKQMPHSLTVWKWQLVGFAYNGFLVRKIFHMLP